MPALLLCGPSPEGLEACAAEVLRGWLESTGPATPSQLATRLAMSPELVEAGLLRLEAEGQVLRGRFTSEACAGEAGAGKTEWCNRRLLARIHRLTLGRLRREIEPVTTAQFLRFLCRWQHLTPGSRLHGVEGTYQVLQQLQGYEIAAAAWESHILPRRIARYSPELLDRLCLSGEVMWGRLSHHPLLERGEPASAGNGGQTRSRRVRPSRVAPVAIFLRNDV